MYFTTRPNTVFLLVGPSMSGKSTFAQALVKAIDRSANARGFNFQSTILSSDANRQWLLGSDTDRHAPAMLEVSRQAFEMLMAQYKAAISYPVNHDFVIVDTTGMDEKFRDDIRELGQAQGYNVELITFEYSKAEALRGVAPRYHDGIKWQLDKMKKKVLPNLKARFYTKRTRIQERSPTKWTDLVLSIENIDVLAKCLIHLNEEDTLCVIGDMHEHVKAGMALTDMLDTEFKDAQIVWIGDYLDKGMQTADTLRFMQERVAQGDILVEGNHESYVVRRLRGEIEPNPEVEAKYITSLAVLQQDEELRKIFFKLYDEHTIPFLKVTVTDGRTMYVTHAPCEEVHLGKLSPFARRAQRNLNRNYAKPEADRRESYQFIFDEASPIHPIHVFGHIDHTSSHLSYKNKVFLDTGAVYGNKLTALVYKEGVYDFRAVPCDRLDQTDRGPNPDATTPIKIEKEFSIRDYDLDDKDIRFLNNFTKNGARYISGTMTPAPKTETQLESLEAALDYYAMRGVESVIMEPKYMGSRAQLYLYRHAPEQSFMTSRNGYKIFPDRVPGLTELIQKEHDKYVKLAVDGQLVWDGTLIIDGELLPWSALGKDLIDRQFTGYGALVEHELCTLHGDPWFQELEFSELELEGKERFFKTKSDTKMQLGELKKFKEALVNYTADVGTDVNKNEQPLQFKAFSILLMDGFDMTGVDQAGVFDIINDDPVHIVYLEQLSGEGRDKELAFAYDFYDDLTIGKKMEGVVVKPLEYTAEMNDKSILPYMKVRNEEYLRLIYGYDYKNRYEKLRQQKNIGGKAKLSMTEYRLGKAMLTAEPNRLKENVVKMIASMKEEKTLDPRL
jgi:predicted kinase